MHFIAMLAFSMSGMEMTYDLPLTLVSLAIAIVFTGAGFAIIDWEGRSWARLISAGLLMGLGVVAMHYVGMAAMQMAAATMSYGRFWVAVSVLIAIGAATAAVWLAARDQRLLHRIAASIVMGVAISGMHYAGMRAAVFTGSSADMAHGDASVGQTYLAILIGSVTCIILLMAQGAARIEKLLLGYQRRDQRNALRIRVSDVLRAESTHDALSELARLLGEHFNVSRCGYGRLDEDADVFEYDVCWTNGTVPQLLGRFPASAFGAKIVAALAAGQTVVIDDLLQAQLSNESLTRKTAEGLDTRAILVVPFVIGGRLRTIIYLNERSPRRWSGDDVRFMEEIADRSRLVIERGAVETELRELNATLEARVDARTRELQEAQEALVQSQKMEAVGQLVSGLAHDFNNVLGSVVGAFDLIRRNPANRERVVKYADAKLQAAQRGAKLTAQLLAFSRSQRIQLSAIPLRRAIEDFRDLLQKTVGPMVELRLALDASSTCVLGDLTQIEMMLLNLAINARDAMPEGGTLTVSTELREMQGDRDLEPGHYIELSVRDTGTGMDEETLRRAMDPFFTTKAVGKGTGLGLAQIYGSVKQSGGTVRIQSALGAGTTVNVFLRCTDEKRATEDRAKVDDVEFDFPPRKILLVDDDDDLRDLLVSALELHGHVVYEARDGKGALILLETECPDIAVLDFAMPEMNGAELAGRIAECRPFLPVLFASGYADTNAVERTVGKNARLIWKPFQIDELLVAIETTLTSSSTEREARADALADQPSDGEARPTTSL
jgi:signal transduction histidine kinase/NO-binding membrane sensor protein with MHYT domain/ActR/RegA family two-component response regulator